MFWYHLSWRLGSLTTMKQQPKQNVSCKIFINNVILCYVTNFNITFKFLSIIFKNILRIQSLRNNVRLRQQLSRRTKTKPSRPKTWWCTILYRYLNSKNIINQLNTFVEVNYYSSKSCAVYIGNMIIRKMIINKLKIKDMLI